MSWPMVKLGDVAERVDYGLTASAKEDNEGPRFLRITDMQDDAVDWSTVPSCECSEKEFKENELSVGDIVFARTGATTGKSFLIRNLPRPSVFASYLIRVRPTDEVDSKYLAYFFKSPQYWFQITAMAEGAAQPGVNSSKLKELEIPLPPLPEQKRIAAILDKADAIRRKRQQAIQLADDFLRAVFLDMFGDPVTNPKGWEVKSVADLIRAGVILQVQDGNHGNDHPKVSDFTESGIPFVTANVVRRGKILFDQCYYLDHSWLDKLRIGFAKPRDVLISHKGSLGFTAVLDDTYEDYIFSPQTTYYRVNEERLLPEYLKGYFDSGFFQSLFAKEGIQSTRAYLGITRQKDLPVMIPEISAQMKFLDVFSKYKNLSEKLFEPTASAEFFSSLNS
ncbi:restriction endonuclease subunit S [Pseudomonas aeruginosa]|uniref:restriction endonuclease subunit S n=1 Tax=Pseudomonas aeruginosa TaxID=287 RepID=UPI003453471F